MRACLFPPMILALALMACNEYELNEKEQPAPDSDALDTASDSTPPVDSPPQETCDGEDDDGDGLIDEDWGDADGDGVADCRDGEGCDGLDNDGDGSTDEGFTDTDGDGTADCVEVEDCDGLDNDGDGLADEGFADADGDSTPDCRDTEDCDGLDNDGDGSTDEGFDADADGTADCLESTYAVTLMLSADDQWEGWVDGAAVGGEAGWSTADVVSLTLDSGTHAVAVHAWDTGAAIAGFIGSVTVDGVGTWLTGTSAWRFTATSPDSAWTTAAFDDGAWGAPVPCPGAEVGTYWGAEPSAILATGATWIWIGDCVALGEGWFRLELTLP